MPYHTNRAMFTGALQSSEVIRLLHRRPYPASCFFSLLMRSEPGYGTIGCVVHLHTAVVCITKDFWKISQCLHHLLGYVTSHSSLFPMVWLLNITLGSYNGLHQQ